MFFLRPFDVRKAHITILILLSGIFAAGLFVPSSTAEIYPDVNKDGVAHLTNIPDGNSSLEVKESWVHFQPEEEFERYDTVIWKAAEKYSVDYALVKAVIKAESNFNPKAVSPAGAKGLMQLMPETANALGVDNSFHPEDNIEGGVRHLRYLLDRFKGDMRLALAAYNSGEKVVFRYKGIPPYKETRTYVKRVMRHFQNYSSELINPDFS